MSNQIAPFAVKFLFSEVVVKIKPNNSSRHCANVVGIHFSVLAKSNQFYLQKEINTLISKTQP